MGQRKRCCLDVTHRAELVPALHSATLTLITAHSLPLLGAELESSFIYENTAEINITCICLEMQVSRANDSDTN